MKQELNLNCFDCNKSLQDCTCMEDIIDMKQDLLEQAAKEYAEMHLDVSGNLGKYLVKAVFQDGAQWQINLKRNKMKEETLEEVKYLAYWKNNAEEDYLKVPISVLRYITELEKTMYNEQEVIELLIKRCKHFGTSVSPFDKLLLKQDLEWFEQFKKKII